MCLRVPIEAGDRFRLVRTTRSATIRPRVRALGLFGNVPKIWLLQAGTPTYRDPALRSFRPGLATRATRSKWARRSVSTGP